jgi:hypothetical protein
LDSGRERSVHDPERGRGSPSRHRQNPRGVELGLQCSGYLASPAAHTSSNPEGFRKNILGRDDDVSIFVGEGIKWQLPIVVDVVAKGRNEVESFAEWLTGIDAPDTIVTPPLSTEQVATLEGWFGSTPPTKVSVVGILETGVFMVGTRAGDAIRELQESCVASPR